MNSFDDNTDLDPTFSNITAEEALTLLKEELQYCFDNKRRMELIATGWQITRDVGYLNHCLTLDHQTPNTNS